jgi:phosphoesterase RecJ-like protein
LFREQKYNKLRVSIRSKGKINIAKLAQHYGGAGHFDAAGCVIADNKKAISALLRDAQKLLKNNRQ